MIIHAAEDTLPARALAEKLRQAQLSVQIEKQGDELRDAVRNAAVTVALWSPRSSAQPALIDEVVAARGKSTIVHTSMQSAPAPEEFRGEPVVNLTGWRGEDDFPAWRELAQLVTSQAGVAPLAPPTQRPPSGFFQPGRQGESAPAPAPRAQQSAPQPRAAAAASPPRPQPQA
ncbi:MAG TPA: toll/interleukin-1 receptor domain-containing protein, partial [Verrucomicrobiae bacterium]|nr:toll/interleukin-1 receptor domain-containing protein [Verrucomicrobiae bacterium]